MRAISMDIYETLRFTFTLKFCLRVNYFNHILKIPEHTFQISTLLKETCDLPKMLLTTRPMEVTLIIKIISSYH